MSKFPIQGINQEEDGRRDIEAAEAIQREEGEATAIVGDDEEEKARCEWDFSLSSTVLPPTTSLCETSDAIGVIEIDPSDTILATGGSARKIRVYTLQSLEGRGFDHDHAGTYDYYICTPAKLSSIRWQPDSGGRVIGSGDYDGVVTEYDLEKRVPVFERDEHGGRRVWSIDYSTSFPSVGASASDDGTVDIWDSRSGGLAVVQPGSMSPVCSVEFDRSGGSTIMAVGSADRCVYLFDLRWPVGEPVAVLRGHRKAVSYVRFLGSGKVVSAGIDGCLKLWDVHATKALRTYEGHVNARNFVGLSVWREGGLLGCGSESNEVYVYDLRWKDPIWVRGLEPWPVLGQSGCGGRFVSSVCWRQHTCGECTLVAGGSNGVLQAFTGKRKETRLS